MLAFLGQRAIGGVEAVTRDAYARTISIAHRGALHVGRIEVRRSPRKSALRVSVSPSLARAVPVVLSRVKRAFDLACDPAVVAAALGPLAAGHPGLRVPGTFDGFELAVRAVVGQQISVRAARTLLGRIARAFGEPAGADEGDALTRLFPTAARIAGGASGRIWRRWASPGRARERSSALAAAVASGAIRARARERRGRDPRGADGASGDRNMDRELRRDAGLALAGCFPRQRSRRPEGAGETRPAHALRSSESWRPWRSYAVMHLWRNAS